MQSLVICRVRACLLAVENSKEFFCPQYAEEKGEKIEINFIVKNGVERFSMDSRTTGK